MPSESYWRNVRSRSVLRQRLWQWAQEIGSWREESRSIARSYPETRAHYDTINGIYLQFRGQGNPIRSQAKGRERRQIAWAALQHCKETWNRRQGQPVPFEAIASGAEIPVQPSTEVLGELPTVEIIDPVDTRDPDTQMQEQSAPAMQFQLVEEDDEAREIHEVTEDEVVQNHQDAGGPERVEASVTHSAGSGFRRSQSEGSQRASDAQPRGNTPTEGAPGSIRTRSGSIRSTNTVVEPGSPIEDEEPTQTPSGSIRSTQTVIVPGSPLEEEGPTQEPAMEIDAEAESDQEFTIEADMEEESEEEPITEIELQDISITSERIRSAQRQWCGSQGCRGGETTSAYGEEEMGSEHGEEVGTGAKLSLRGMSRFINDLLPIVSDAFFVRTQGEREDGVTNLLSPTSIGASGRVQRSEILGCDWEALMTGRVGGCAAPQLSFAKSQQEYMDRLTATREESGDGVDGGIHIERCWDIDSSWLRIISLDACNEGFTLTLFPQFVKCIKGTSLLGPEFLEPEKRFNFFVGTPVRGKDYGIWVIFGKKGKSEPFPKEHVLEELMDKVWIPALYQALPSNKRMRFPRTFHDAKTKATAKLEVSGPEFGVSTAGAHVEHIIPQECARQWHRVALELFEGNELIRRELGDEMKFVCQRHNTKERFVDEDFQHVKSTHEANLRHIFTYGDDKLKEDHLWLDSGAEEVPETFGYAEGGGVVLIRKSECLEHWMDNFADQEGRRRRAGAGLNRRRYRWMGTRDAGSADIELKSTNRVRQESSDGGQGKVYHAKAYNSQKDVFSASVYKGLELLQSEDFISGAFLEDELLQEAMRTRGQHSEPGGLKGARERRIQAFLRCMERFRASLRGFKRPNLNMQARFEIRQSKRFFDAFQPGDTSVITIRTSADLIRTTSEGELHLPYWVLDAEDVHLFIMHELDRDLCLIEALIAEADKQVGRELVPKLDMMHNHAMGIAMIGLVRAKAMGSAIDQIPKLWKDRFVAQYPSIAGNHNSDTRLNVNINDEAGDALDEAADGRHSNGTWETAVTAGTARQGLNLKQQVVETGMCWLDPKYLCRRGRVLGFDLERFPVIAFIYGGVVYNRFRVSWVRQKLDRQGRIFNIINSRIDETLREASNDNGTEGSQEPLDGLNVMKAAAEVVVQQFFFDIVDEVARIATMSGGKQASRRVKRAMVREILERLPDPEARMGLRGLDHSLMLCITNQEEAKAAVARDAGKWMRDLKTHHWSDRVRILFNSSAFDKPSERRSWENKTYRALATEFERLFEFRYPTGAGDRFRGVLIAVASQKLWALPRSEQTKWICEAGHGFYGALSQARFDSLTREQKVNWYVAVVKTRVLHYLHEGRSTVTSQGGAFPLAKVKRVFHQDWKGLNTVDDASIISRRETDWCPYLSLAREIGEEADRYESIGTDTTS